MFVLVTLAGRNRYTLTLRIGMFVWTVTLMLLLAPTRVPAADRQTCFVLLAVSMAVWVPKQIILLALTYSVA